MQNNLLNYHKEERQKDGTEDNTIEDDKEDITMTNDDNKEGRGNFSNLRVRND